MFFSWFQLSHKASDRGFAGWGMGTGERHIPVEWHVNSPDDATSLPADVGDKTKSQVSKAWLMTHNVWSVGFLLMGTLASGSQTSVLQKNPSVIALFNHFIRICEVRTTRCAKDRGEYNVKNK